MAPTTAIPPAPASALPAAVAAVAAAAPVRIAPVRLPSAGQTTASAAKQPVETKPVSEAKTVPDAQPVPESKSTPDGGPTVERQAGPDEKAAAEPKRKRKKKKKANGSVLLPGSDGTFRDQALENAEASITGDDAAAWRQRASARIRRLQGACADLARAREELATATACAHDAEAAERAVNQGLRGAKALLEQRDKALGALQEANGRLGAEVATMTDAAKKTEKRLLLLKTVSKNLQEARDERDAAAARAEESATQVAELRKEVAAMEALGVRLGETENVVKQRDEELARLTAETTAKEVAHESRIRLVGAVAAAGGAVFGIILRAIVPRSDHREE